MTEVYLNGKFVGHTEDHVLFSEQFKSERRKGNLTWNVNVHYNERADILEVEGSKGRASRPLIVVKDGIPLLTDKHITQLQKGEMTWGDLVQQGVIEWLDVGEEENALVAFTEKELTPSHTHLEINPMCMMGLCASLVPFANHSPCARINAGTKNQKQALGLYAANYLVRLDMDVSILHSPQVPLVRTLMNDVYDFEKHPAGQNITVAVMCYEGYNMEDAIILNKSSIDRGMGRSTYFRPTIAEEMRYAGGMVDDISVPDKDVKGYKSEQDYRLLEKDGIIFPEANVKEGDVLIGKTSPPRFLSSMEEYNLAAATRRESSLQVAHGEHGVVDFVFLTENEEGNKMIEVRIRDQKIPEIGDKFTSRHGQKGVVGLIVPSADMPFTASGITPDLLFSPHGVPSRMTMSHLLELLGGKMGALSGRYIDGTTFNSEKEKDMRDELLRMGFRDNGLETMYDGRTGKQFKVRIFIGNMFYLKLKHMVSNKLHARARGPVQLLTRQPTEGRAKEGGLRLGEMEKDTFVAHGASLLLKERFDADKTLVPVCEKCGMIAVVDEKRNIHQCPICGESDISNVEMSYAFKLFMDELRSMCINPKLSLENKY